MSDMIIWTLIALLLAGVVSAPAAVLLAECIASFLPRRRDPAPPSSPSPRIVVVPAHNEERTIAPTIRSILAGCRPQDRLLVVADNCSDSTADLCRSLGAEVLERNDPSQAGKGYALAAAIDFIAAAPPGIVIFFDADVIPHGDCIDLLSEAATRRGCPVQAIYLLRPPAPTSPRDALSAFAFATKNKVRPLGLDRLGLPVQLTGAGMAFPWEVVSRLPMASGNIVEDMQLGVDAAMADRPPILVPAALVTGSLPSGSEAATRQRERWEQGHLKTALAAGPRLALAGILRGSPRLLGLALDLMVPPLSLLIMLALVVLAGTGAVAWRTTSPTVFIAGVAPIAMVAAALALAWLRLGADRPSALTLLAAPLYLLWKLPLYINAVLKPQRRWIRTERD
jgi:cellulose synthase/poly-beta-1,6-N-acetylglucosamine synthase-like glycosyltransferase